MKAPTPANKVRKTLTVTGRADDAVPEPSEDPPEEGVEVGVGGIVERERVVVVMVRVPEGGRLSVAVGGESPVMVGESLVMVGDSLVMVGTVSGGVDGMSIGVVEGEYSMMVLGGGV